ncbi:hypothetical protein RP726_16860 [Candidatus Methylospira mobilis]|uniref:hypothetical protein n=1 Tax=Candidatus Methylospira mobilis TaxID=1808979 RepID=UPI0028E4AE23|nr:hypothetical protein [Candidatus Methylospira mobilis]WNV04072.1 hypothetical protein RP726_16860 [Candidatus Methylospira mobilis]
MNKFALMFATVLLFSCIGVAQASQTDTVKTMEELLNDGFEVKSSNMPAMTTAFILFLQKKELLFMCSFLLNKNSINMDPCVQVKQTVGAPSASSAIEQKLDQKRKSVNILDLPDQPRKP